MDCLFLSTFSIFSGKYKYICYGLFKWISQLIWRLILKRRNNLELEFLLADLTISLTDLSRDPISDKIDYCNTVKVIDHPFSIISLIESQGAHLWYIPSCDIIINKCFIFTTEEFNIPPKSSNTCCSFGCTIYLFILSYSTFKQVSNPT